MTSPLRYPGGKTRGCTLIWALLQKEYPGTTSLASPFFGGGSFELFCAAKGITVNANDLFEPLANFWTQLKSHPIDLAQTVELFRPLSKADFYRFRESIQVESDPLLRAAYYFCINRSSFSGATFCGGYSEQAAKGRFTASSIERLRLTDMRNIKTFSHVPAVDFIRTLPGDTVLFLDPPYHITNYLYGRDGDLHAGFNHEELATVLLTRKKWILCYNDCEYIRNLYKGCRIIPMSWSYGMNATKKSNEIVILPGDGWGHPTNTEKAQEAS
jgi:DNA adenine methylase